MTDLEEKFGFEYPTFYKKLAEDGMLDWEFDVLQENRNQWKEEIAPKFSENPPFLFSSLAKEIQLEGGFELLSPVAVNELLEDPPWPLHYQFIPFAKEIGPAYYGFYFQLKQGEDIPIAFLFPEMKDGEIVAKNLKDFIFRQLLQHAVHIPKSVDQDQYREELSKILESHKNYLSLEWYIKLHSIFQKPVTKYKHEAIKEGGFLIKIINFILRNYLGMISWEEFNSLRVEE